MRMEDLLSQKNSASKTSEAQEKIPSQSTISGNLQQEQQKQSLSHWGSESEDASDRDNASQEDNAGFSKLCTNGKEHCHIRKEISWGEAYCSICNSILTASCGYCDRFDYFLCLPCMKKYDYETVNVCADSYYLP